MSQFKFERSFPLPKRAIRVADKASDAVAYVFENAGGLPCATVFFGKQAKPVGNYRFRNEAERETYIKRCFTSRQAHATTKAARRVADKAFEHDYKVGDIFRTSWGYDQTNVEFFEITALIGSKMVELREIARVSEQTGMDQYRCVPQSGAFLEPRHEGCDRGKPIRRLAQKHGIKIDDVRTSWKWNTQTVAGVPMGGSCYWSEGH